LAGCAKLVVSTGTKSYCRPTFCAPCLEYRRIVPIQRTRNLITKVAEKVHANKE
jgi:hypothetical protein